MPVVDALVAALVLSPLVYIAVAEDNQSDRTLGLVLGVPFFGSTAVAYGSSSFYGFRETNRCRQLHRAYESMEPLPDASPGPSADSRYQREAPQPSSTDVAEQQSAKARERAPRD